jgi:hypothetical protein
VRQTRRNERSFPKACDCGKGWLFESCLSEPDRAYLEKFKGESEPAAKRRESSLDAKDSAELEARRSALDTRQQAETRDEANNAGKEGLELNAKLIAHYPEKFGWEAWLDGCQVCASGVISIHWGLPDFRERRVGI